MAVRFRNLSLGYAGRPVIHCLDGEIPAGALLALVGPNGAGKSTLLKGILGELTPISGSMERSGFRHGEIAAMPQSAEIDRSFPLSLFDMVGAGLWRSVGALRGFGASGTRKIMEGLDFVGLAGLEHRPVSALSGGQFQRALFCRMLLQDAAVILLDEPFASIDRETTTDLLRLILGWHRRGRTILAALHDLDQVRAHFPETLLLAGGPIAWGPTATVLTDANLALAQRRAHEMGNTGGFVTAPDPIRA